VLIITVGASTTAMSKYVLLPVESARATSVEHIRTTPKEHSENVIRVKLVFAELLAISLSEILISAMLIIDLSLLWVVQAGKSRTDLLESISSIWGSVLVRVKFESKFLVSFFDFFLRCSFS